MLAAQSRGSGETEGSEVTPAAMKFLVLASETLADVTDEEVVRDVDALLETAASFGLCGASVRLSSDSISPKPASDDQPEPSAQSDPDVHVKPYPLLVSSEKVSSDLSASQGSCVQVLKGLLAKLLAFFQPDDRPAQIIPAHLGVASVASDILDIAVNGVKDICQKKKS